MRIKKVSFKNFRSYGNNMTTFVIDDGDESSLNLIVGRNGAGKTTIALAVTYCLYGRVEDVKNSSLCNRINKNLYVECEVQCGNNNLLIKRGQHPALFEVFINGDLYDQAGKTNVQELLETSYYHVPYTIFKNLIVLNINDFKSLLTLTPGEKRGIIDKIFGFSVLNEMAKSVKDDFKATANTLSDVRTQIATIASSIEITSTKAKELLGKKPDAQKLQKLTDIIDETSKKATDLQTMLGKLQTADTMIRQDIHNRSSDILVIDKDRNALLKKIELIECGKCPLCGSDLHSQEFNEELASYRDTIQQLDERKQTITESIDEYTTKLQKVIDKTSTTNSSISTISQTLVSLKSELRYNEGLQQQDNSQLDSILLEFQEKLEALQVQEQKITTAYNMLNLASKLFSDNGVKKYVGSKYTPVINEILVDISNKLHIPYQVRFDDSFDCIVTHIGRDVEYDTLSSGERRKLDFTVIISFLKMLKLQFPDINLLFADEIFATMDVDTVPEIIEILYELTSQLRLHIFLIHHSVFDAAEFNHTYRLTKDSGFTVINKI